MLPTQLEQKSSARAPGLGRVAVRNIGFASLASLLLLWAPCALAKAPSILAKAPAAARAPGPTGDPLQVSAAEVPIQVEMTTHLGDGQRFLKGDTIAFFLSLDTDAYIEAIYEDARHRRIQIVPNANQADNYYPAGTYTPIPDADAPFRFTVAEPFHEERLWVFAAKDPIATLPGKLLDNGLKQLNVDMATIKRQIKTQAGPAFGEFCLPIRALAGN